MVLMLVLWTKGVGRNLEVYPVQWVIDTAFRWKVGNRSDGTGEAWAKKELENLRHDTWM